MLTKSIFTLIFLCYSVLSAGDVIEEATAAGLSAFIDAVQTSDLTESAKEMDSPAPFTVFVPSNLAFAYTNLDHTREMLRPRLMYHVIPGTKLAKENLSGKLESIAGSSITITDEGKIKGASEEAEITRSIVCSNGILHIIDKVLTPTEPEDEED